MIKRIYVKNFKQENVFFLTAGIKGLPILEIVNLVA